jgi:serine/threonine protein kinase
MVSPDKEDESWKNFLETIQKQNVKTLYKVEAVIGLGTYGKVRLARERSSNKLVAVKSLRISDSNQTKN